jgi:hypothetical protein
MRETPAPKVRRRRKPSAKPTSVAVSSTPTELADVTVRDAFRLKGATEPPLEIALTASGSLEHRRNFSPLVVGACRKAVEILKQTWRRLQARRQRHLESKRLCLCESVSLGEKRFLAIVQVDGQYFLVGGAQSSVSLLAKLSGHSEFADALNQRRTSERLRG